MMMISLRQPWGPIYNRRRSTFASISGLAGVLEDVILHWGDSGNRASSSIGLDGWYDHSSSVCVALGPEALRLRIEIS